MADRNLPPVGLPGSAEKLLTDSRRAFLRRAVGTGLPVVLATVAGRSALAQEPVLPTQSGCASMTPSGWRTRTYGDEDNYSEANPHPCDSLTEEQLLAQPEPAPEPIFDDPLADPPDDPKNGGGWGKGGKPK